MLPGQCGGAYSGDASVYHRPPFSGGEIDGSLRWEESSERRMRALKSSVFAGGYDVQVYVRW